MNLLALFRKPEPTTRYIVATRHWCWNRYWLPLQEYRRLVRTLAQNGWHCTGGLARWGNAYDALAAKAEA